MAIESVSAGTGEVNLVLSPTTLASGVGDLVEIRLFAVSTTGANVGMSGVNAVLTWDPAALELSGYANNPAYGWLFSGFLGDSGADGLNNSHDDGDALFQAVGQFSVPAIATPGGYLITTFSFNALKRTERTCVRLETQQGVHSRTEVFRFDGINEDIVGEMQPGYVAVAADRKLWPLDVSLRAGRTADVIVFGEFAGADTFGVRVQAELVNKGTLTGSLHFTPAPPEDVYQAGDPWQGVGSFTAFDTNTAGGDLMLNGSVSDNGTFLPGSLAYLGALTGMPVVASADASGFAVIRLATSAGSSLWEPELETELGEGVIRVVGPHDGDGNDAVELSDFSEFQACFTGPVGPADPPAFDRDPRRRCGVYDDDADGDVDESDFASFAGVLNGPIVATAKVAAARSRRK